MSELKGHTVAETPTGVARALLYVHSQGISLLQVILTYLSSGYEPGSQGTFIEEPFHCIILLRSLILRATYKFAARRPQYLDGMTKCNLACYNYQRSIMQQSDVIQYLLAVAEMKISCSQ